MHALKSASTCDAALRCAVACICSEPRTPPCSRMALAFAGKLALCDQLEAIADSLPASVDRMACMRVATGLLPFLRQCHRYEEDTLYPAFEYGSPRSYRAADTLIRLRAEHIQDECAAEEITEQLMWIGRGGDVDNPEALGFMLRAFFSAVRRHIAFECEHIAPPG